MPRPKGSKNKATLAKELENAPPVELDDIDDEVAAVEAMADSGEDIEDDADDEDDEVAPTGPPPGMMAVTAIRDQSLLEAFREQTETLKGMMPAKKVTFAQFKTKSSFNPTGRRRKLKFTLYQNGYRCNVKTLTDEEVDLVNSGKIKSGMYIDKLVSVRVDPGIDGKIDVSYNNKSIDQRMMLRDRWHGLGDLLKKIIAEGEARRERVIRRRAELSA